MSSVALLPVKDSVSSTRRSVSAAGSQVVPEVVSPSPAKRAAQTYAGTVYWDKRYEDRACNFEWFFSYSAVQDLFRKALGPVRSLPCLHVGVGNSTIQEGMEADGFAHVINIDVSSVVIEQMKLHNGTGNPALEYMVCDCRDMHQFADGCFGGVIDKGTLDAVACGPTGSQDIALYLNEVDRVLRPGGVFLLVSLGAPAVRRPLLTGPTRLGWTVEVLLLPKPSSYLAGEAYRSGRVLSPGRAQCSKDSPIAALGPFSWEQADAKLLLEHSTTQGKDQHDFFFAYVVRKAGELDLTRSPRPQKTPAVLQSTEGTCGDAFSKQEKPRRLSVELPRAHRGGDAFRHGLMHVPPPASGSDGLFVQSLVAGLSDTLGKVSLDGGASQLSFHSSSDVASSSGGGEAALASHVVLAHGAGDMHGL